MNSIYIDMSVVLFYFFIILLAGYLVGKKHRSDSAADYLTGGRSLNWFKTGLTLIAMSIDTGIMGVVGIGFVWGFAIQWNAVNLWITAPLAAMFLIPIYWRTKIVTTPELLEKRFNVFCRAFFSVVMSVYMIVVLGTSIYLGALILNELFGLNLYVCCALILTITGFYVMMGGMKTILAINIYQSVFISLALITVGVMTIYKVGGIGAIADIKELNDSGIVMPSTAMPVDWNIFSELWYPIPSGFIWAILGGTAWIACNFGLVQRLLASKSEKDAQKAIMFCGFGVIVLFTFAYLVGVSVRFMMPDSLPDKAYLKAILSFFPVGIRGMLIAGLIASLLSTIDGLMIASSTLITEDIYLRFLSPNADSFRIKRFARIVQIVIIFTSLILVPVAAKSRTVTQLIQSLVADMFGVLIALYFVGVFSVRTTSRAALMAMVSGIILAVYLDFGTDISFPNVGIFSFAWAVAVSLVLSRFEKAPDRKKLENLTVYTIPGVKGPFIGLNAWPNLWKYTVGVAVFWLGLTLVWEIYIRWQ